MDETFLADVYMEAKWIDNTLDPNEAFEDKKHWKPNLFVENLIGTFKEKIKRFTVYHRQAGEDLQKRSSHEADRL